MHVVRMASAMSRLGHDVLLVARTGDPRLGSAYAHYGTSGFEIETLPISRLPGLRPWIGALQAKRLVRSWKADLAYGRDPHALYAAARGGLPVGFEMHQVARGRRARLEARLVRHPRFRLATFITSMLESDYLALIPALAGVQRMVAADGADVVDAARLTNRSLDAPFTVGYVGHLYAGRGIELIVDLARRLPDVRFELVGGAPDDIERTRAISGDMPNVVITGHVAPADVTSYLTRHDVVLAPYQVGLRTARGGDTSRWMSPLKIFEYMAHGRPIIASDLPVLREVLRHEANALMVDPTDVGGWESAIRRLRSSQELRTQLGACARSEVESTYSWEHRSTRIIDAVMGG